MLATPKVVLLGLVIDAAFGDPAVVYDRMPHPVALIGRAVAWLDRRWNSEDRAEHARRQAGTVICLVLVLASAVAGLAIERGLAELRFGWIFEGAILSLFLAQQS